MYLGIHAIFHRSVCEAATKFKEKKQKLIEDEFAFSGKFEEDLFCIGYFEADRENEHILLLLGDPNHIPPCMYCEEWYYGIKINIISNTAKSNRATPEYIYGFNQRMKEKFNSPIFGSKCNDNEYFNSKKVEDYLTTNIQIVWMKDSVRLNFTSRELDIDKYMNELAVTFSLPSNQIQKGIFKDIYKGVTFPCKGNFLGLEVNMNKYDNPKYCHFFFEKKDVVKVFFFRES